MIATVLAFSHEEQVHRLQASSPAAVARARVVGDLVSDQLAASVVRRRVYREALGVEPGQTLVVVSSTWGPESLLGVAPQLPSMLGLQLPVDEFRTVIAAHPNITHGHSPWQLRRWLAACARAGVTPLDDVDAWQAALVAADVVIGDHSSVAFWAAVLGRPVLLAAAPEDALDPGSPVGGFVRRAPRLDPDADLAAQLRSAVTDHDPAALSDLTRLATSRPGAARRTLRPLLYELLDLVEPDHPPITPLVRVPDRVDRRVASHLVAVTVTGPRAAEVVRYPAERLRHRDPGQRDPGQGDPGQGDPGTAGTLLVVGPDETDSRWIALADVVVGTAADGEEDGTAALLAGSAGAALAVAPAADGWWLRDRHGARLHLDDGGELFAPVAATLLQEGRGWGDLVGRWSVTMGARRVEVVADRPGA